MNILVTGGGGYVGSVLVPHLLSAGHRVRVLDSLLHGGHALLPVWSHRNFSFTRGDVRDRNTVRDAVQQSDAVVHLAAIVGDPACAREPELARSTNLDGSYLLLDECQRAGVHRFVFASTCSNYGKMTDESELVDEESELRPISLYANTKVEIEKYVLDAQSTGDMCTTALRFATVFGMSPRMRFDLTVNEFTMELKTAGHLVVFGEQFWRPYIHVSDMARGVACVLHACEERVSHRVFNVGSTQQNYQKQRLVELIRPHAPNATVEYVHKEEDPRSYKVSFQRIRQELGFSTARSVEDGIFEIVRLIDSGIISDYHAHQFRN